MKGSKGLIITGTVFVFVILLLIGANYVLLSSFSHQEGDYEKMLLDKTYNRYIDVNRIIQDIVDDSLTDGADCFEKAGLIDSRLQNTLSSPLLDSNEIILIFTKTVANTCVGGGGGQITVDVEFSLDAQNIHKEGSYSTAVNG